MSYKSLISLFLGSLTVSSAIAPAALAQTPASSSVISQTTGTAGDLGIPARLHVEYQNFAGDGEGYGRLEGLIPLGQTPGRSVTFFNPQVVWDATYEVTDAFFQGNSLVLQLGGQVIDEYEAALGGVDLEGGIRLTEFANGGDLRGYGGLYYLAGNSSDSVVGGRVRLAARPTPFFNLGLGLQSDGLFGTRVLFSIGATFPGYGTTTITPTEAGVDEARSLLWSRAGESITRNNTM